MSVTPLDVTLGIVAPDGREGMLQHAREFAAAGIPFIFDPGQGLPMFSGEEVLEFARQADYLTVNDYEAQLLQEKTGQTLAALARHVKALIVTLGANGSLIYTAGRELEIPSAKPDCDCRSDRLRRRLPRGAVVWHRRRAGLGVDRAARLADGRAQDRAPRRAEPSLHARRNRGTFQAELRHRHLVTVRDVERLRAIALLLACALVAGCATKSAADRKAGEELDVRMGVVEEVRRVPLPASGGYIGSVGGAAAGGIAGGTLGSGRGSQAASVFGAVAGSVAGYAIENSMTAREGLEISVRLDSGSLILVLQPDGEAFKPGERVRVMSGVNSTRVTH